MSVIRLPDTMSRWPFPRRINPYYPEVAEESASWLRSFHAFSPAAQRAFDRCEFGLITVLAYPTLSREEYRSSCDLMNLFFLIEEHTDLLDELGASAVAKASLDALMNPDKARPEGESIIGEVTRQFWSRVCKYATPTAKRHFEESWLRFVTSIAEQARDRDQHRTRTVDEYLELRRLTIGAEPCYAFAMLAKSLPEDLVNHQLLVSLRASVTDIIIYDNDMISYNKEQAAGDDGHNVLTIVMEERKLDITAAMQWLADQHGEQVDRALSLLPQVLALIATAGPHAAALASYLDHLVTWPRANNCWHFESGRYFGADGRQIQKTRLITLSPRGVALAPEA
ncbi:terpenoid synthase [Cubamyces sp. BRFM 1775]|nr:terpenoid synthase [Cubamyces sp. BRFM 1775]